MADIQTYIILLLIWLASLILVKTIFSKKKTAYRLPPSPTALPIIGHLHLLAPIPHQALHKLSTKHGPLMHIRLGSVPCVVASSPEIAKEFLKTHESSFSNRPITTAVDYLTYGSADFSFAPYGPYWKFMKKICMSQLLSGRMLEQFFPVRGEELRRFLRFMEKKESAGEKVDVRGELVRLTNNIVSRMIMNQTCSGNEDEAEEVRKLVEATAELTGRFNLSDFIWFCKNLDLQGMKKKIKHDLFAAGTDTSALTTEWALSELINHPNIMEKAREEMDSVVGKKRIVAESDIIDLPYLHAIVKETLRLHTGPMIVRESTEDCIIGGYKIPAKTRLFVNVWAIGREPNHWEKPLEFRPERSCPGTTMALDVVQTSLAAMIQCFDWEVDDGSVDMEGPGLTLPRAHPLMCVPVLRLNPFPSV
ncbi:putative cytochrome P450 [Hibiscus syriacus]|uniref:Cytochrome P450 n=1 Tax=Hibiscus syriacus TaxID=106335 RepID=A0A6A3AJ83_HIBSY|nr:putative cytochrome P450 [Hibiscus syriacus]